WNSVLNALMPALCLSTQALPKTLRRTLMPRAWRSLSSMARSLRQRIFNASATDRTPRSAARHARLRGGDEPLDEVLRESLVGQRLDQLGDLAGIHEKRHPFVLAQHLLQVALLGDRFLDGLLDDLLRDRLAELG